MVSFSVNLCLSFVLSFAPLFIPVRRGCTAARALLCFQGGYTAVSGNSDVTGHRVSTQPAFPVVSEEKVHSLAWFSVRVPDDLLR